MKKPARLKSLKLTAEAIRVLSNDLLPTVVGGRSRGPTEQSGVATGCIPTSGESLAGC